ncbi:MAG: hypothetical protein ACTSVI_01445 [Promethearchaeota archaeon]
MKNQMSRFTLFSSLLATLMMVSIITGANAQAINTSAWNVPFSPHDTIIGDFLAHTQDIINGAQKANINGTNVYYFNHSVDGSRSNSLNVNDQGALSFSVADIKNYFGEWFNNLTMVSGSITAWNTALTGFSFTGYSDGWKDKEWKEIISMEWMAIIATYNGTTPSIGAFTSFLTNIEDEFTKGISSNKLPGIIRTTSWANATPEEVMMILNSYLKPDNTLWPMQVVYRAQNGISSLTSLNITAIVNYFLSILGPAKLELESGVTSLNINYSLHVDLTSNSNITDKAVVILWDHDDSVRRAVESTKKIKPNPFTGDEVFYMVHFNKIATKISGDLISNVTWKYDDNSSPSSFLDALKVITSSPYPTQLISSASGVPLNLLRVLIHGNVSVVNGTRIYHDATFGMGQLRINQFDFSFNLATKTLESDVDIWYGEHKWVGLFAYEDLNNNSIQDISVEGSAPFLYPTSNESRYRFRIEQVDSIIYQAPQVVNNELAFGINFTGIQGEFVPFDISEETVMMNNTVDGSLPENVSQIAFNFRFGVDLKESASKMKVDYIFGDFENNGTVDPALENYSLSMVTLFSVYRLQHGSRVVGDNSIIGDNNSTINVNESNAHAVGTVRFASGSSLRDRIFEFNLTEIPYSLGGSSYTAYGQLIPAKMGGISYGRTTVVGNYTRESTTSIFGAVILYSVNFPTWGGHAIIHDPVFSTFVPTGSSTGGLSKPLLYTLVISGIAAVAVVVIIGIVKARSRSSAFNQGFHQVSLENSSGRTRSVIAEKDRHGHSLNIDLIFSFFFQFHEDEKIRDIASKDNEFLMDAYEIDNFNYFSNLIAFYTFKLDARHGSWNHLIWKEYNNENKGNSSIFRKDRLIELLMSDVLNSQEKMPLESQTGKGYVYKITIPQDSIYLIDVIIKFSNELNTTLRVGLISRSQLSTEKYKYFEEVSSMISAFLEKMIEKESKLPTYILPVLEGLLPVFLSEDHEITSTFIHEFYRKILNDDSIPVEDKLTIGQDLKRLNSKLSREVISNMDLGQERQGDDSSDKNVN